jgi:hypothetical protein
MIVGFTTTCATSAYNHWSYEFEPRSWRGVLDTTLCDKVCQWLATCRWFSPGTPVLSTNIANRHEITEILLKVALNSINHHIHIKFLRSNSQNIKWTPLRYIYRFFLPSWIKNHNKSIYSSQVYINQTELCDSPRDLIYQGKFVNLRTFKSQ